MKFSAKISINADAYKVWAVLQKTEDYPTWDPYCDKIEGNVALNQKIKAFSKLSPGRAFPVKVTRLDPGKHMTWSGGMPLGLFKGERNFILTALPDGSTDFEMVEEFSGPMLKLIGKSLPDMTEPFAAFAKGLKSKSEE